LRAITEADGLTENAGGTIFVLRQSSNGLSDQLAISTHDLMIRNDQTVNIPVFANDWINVPRAVDITVSCLGAFRDQGTLVFRSTENVTVIGAIARAGGLTDEAADKITIKREGSEDSVGSYKIILSGKDPNMELEDGDILIVKESFF
jgi:protein involved in polysaccharide export with SLBB domain